MADLLGLLGQGANALYGEKQFDQARDDIKGGFRDARQDVKKYQQPYTDFGLEQMGQFQARPDFKFGMEEFEASPGYEFRQAEGAKAVQRSNAANKMLQSGNTLAGLQQRGQDIAKDEFQAGYERALGAYKTNDQRNQFGISTGAAMAQNLGDNLADIGIGKGISMAQLNGMQAQRMSDLISSTLAAAGQPSDPSSVSSMINEAISSGSGSVADFLKEKVGGLLGGAGGALAGKVAGAFGAGAGSALESAAFMNAPFEYLGAEGIQGYLTKEIGKEGASQLASTYGGDALSGSAAATSGFASWAATAAAGVGALMAFRGLMKTLQGPSKWSKLLGKLEGTKDPLGDIQKLIKSGDAASYQDKRENMATRGALYSTFLKNIDSETADGLKYHKDIGGIANDLFEWAKSGESNQVTTGAHPYKALQKLFPEISEDIQLLGEGSMRGKMEDKYQNTRDDSGSWTASMDRSNNYNNRARNKGLAAERRVRKYMRQKIHEWKSMQSASSLYEDIIKEST